VTVGHGDHERVDADLRGLQVRRLRDDSKERSVELAGCQVVQHVLGRLFAPDDPEQRILATPRLCHLGEQVGRHCRDDAEPERRGEGVTRPVRGSNQVGELDQDTPSPGDDVGARGGDQHAPLVTLEELEPEDLLQLPHLRAQARLRNAAVLGRPVEDERIGDRDDVLKLTDGDVVEGGHGRGTLTLT